MCFHFPDESIPEFLCRRCHPELKNERPAPPVKAEEEAPTARGKIAPVLPG